MKKCLVCGQEATHAVEDVFEGKGTYEYSCVKHIDKVLDLIEDKELIKIMRERINNNNSKVGYNLDDIKKSNKERNKV